MLWGEKQQAPRPGVGVYRVWSRISGDPSVAEAECVMLGSGVVAMGMMDDVSIILTKSL